MLGLIPSLYGPVFPSSGTRFLLKILTNRETISDNHWKPGSTNESIYAQGSGKSQCSLSQTS